MPLVYGDESYNDILSYGFSQQELLGLAYIKSIRASVVDRGFTYLSSWDGRHRSGKSLTATAFAYLLDPTFWPNFEARLVSEPHQFVDEIEKISKSKTKGAVIIIDEAGVSLPSSDWYEAWMKTITKMVQMFGYLNPVVFFCSPVRDFVDAKIRKMFHTYHSVSRYTNEFATITPYNLKYSSVMGKMLYRKPIIRLAGTKTILKSIRFAKPPSFMIDRYEAMANLQKDKLLDKFMAEMKKGDIKAIKAEMDLDKAIAGIVQNHNLYLSKRSDPDNPTLDPTYIEFSLKVNSRMATYIKRRAEDTLRDQIKAKKESMNRITSEGGGKP